MFQGNAVTRQSKRVGLAIAFVAAIMVVCTSVVLGAGLQITSFTPGSAGPGASVVITGSGFTGATSVTFGAAAAVYHIDSDTQITATVPAAAPAKAKIKVATPAGTATSATAFTKLVTAKPTFTSFTPTSGGTGTSVVITGTHFSGAIGVTFGGIAATFDVDSDTQVTAAVPASAPAKAKIRVTTAAGSATSPTTFTRPVAAKPTITSFSPTISGTGSAVVITGTHFTGATGVTFGTSAAFTVDSDTRITAIVPLTAPAKIKINVTTPAGSVKSATAWVKGDCQCNAGGGGTPALITVTPSSAQPGTQVRIDGTGVADATSIQFGGVPATSGMVDGANSIWVTVPSGAKTGPVTVTAPGHSWQTASDFTVIPFFITSLSPDHGPVGTQVVITGSGFTGTTEVVFNGIDATFTVNSNTKITSTVPSGAVTDLVKVWVGSHVATSQDAFTVTS